MGPTYKRKQKQAMRLAQGKLVGNKSSKRRRKRIDQQQVLAGLVAANQNEKATLNGNESPRKRKVQVQAAAVDRGKMNGSGNGSASIHAASKVTLFVEDDRKGNEGSEILLPTAFSSEMMTMVDDDDDTAAPSRTATIRRIWTGLLKRKTKNRTNSTAASSASESARWTPSPFQLQSWSILLPPPPPPPLSKAEKRLSNAEKRLSKAEKKAMKEETKAAKEETKAATPPLLNLVGIAPTGSGKTLAYGLPLMMNVPHKRSDGIDGIVLAPTRELAIQIGNEMTGLVEAGGYQKTTKVVTVYGGKVDMEEQIHHLSKCKKHGMVLVSTPGRLVDIYDHEKRIEGWLSTVTIVILDEADRLAIHPDMAEQVDALLELCGTAYTPRIRMGLFSATAPRKVNDKWNQWASSPRAILKMNAVSFGGSGNDSTKKPHTNQQQKDRFAEFSQMPSHVSQVVHFCERAKKKETFINVFRKIRSLEGRHKGLCVVFFDTIKTLEKVHKQLLLASNAGSGEEEAAITNKHTCAAFHGQLSQIQREKTLSDFRGGKVTTLLATDLAARGIHINHIRFVINYDFPESLHQYVHRCGRAGRTKITEQKPQDAFVHSFFTRQDGACAAQDLVALLHGGSADVQIDPNLLAFVAASVSTSATDVITMSGSDHPSPKKRPRI